MMNEKQVLNLGDVENNYYPVIHDVKVLKSRRNKAVYLEIRGKQRDYNSDREWEFYAVYLAESPAQMKKLIRKHIGENVNTPEFPVRSVGKDDFDCMFGNARISWAGLQGFLIEQLKKGALPESMEMEKVFEAEGLELVFKALRRKVIDFQYFNRKVRLKSSYEHNMFIERLKDVVTQIFPYLPESIRESEEKLAVILGNAFFHHELTKDEYSGAV